MFGLKANGRFLDLTPGSSTEIERKSPFFAINDYASEATTDSLVFPYTQNNAIALGLPYQFYSLRSKKTVEAEQYDGNNFRSRCTLVIESAVLDLNNIESSNISGYVLYGISHFFQDIKGKKLSDLKLGGVRTFNWTTNVPDDGSDGFWQHVHATWTDDAIPYVCTPIRNETWLGESVEWLNGLGNDGKIKYDFTNPIVPLIRTRYLLQQIFSESGWQVDFTGLNDADWDKLVWLSLKDIGWASPGAGAPNSVITFSLSDFVPQNRTISDFIVQLFNRYGWAPVFSMVTKTCRMVAVTGISNGPRIDWTKYARPTLPSSFNQDKKIFSLTNEIDSNDTFPSAPNFVGKRFGIPVESAKLLPTPTAFEFGTLRFCFQENQWFEVTFDEVLSELQWTVFSDNIYNEEPTDSTDTIATTISTLPMYLTRYREQDGVDYYAYFPYMKQSRDTDFGYRSLFFHGLCTELDVDGNAGLIDIPTASSILVDHLGNKKTGWSNVYRHVETNDSIIQDYGIIQKWLAAFLYILDNGEEIDTELQLPLRELYNFGWDMVVIIRNISFLVKSIIEPVPYAGVVKATLKRLVTPLQLINAGAARRVYARLTVINIRADYGGVGPYGSGYSSYQSCDVQVELFSDAAATVPFVPLTALVLKVTTQVTDTFFPGYITRTAETISISNQTEVIYDRVMYDADNTFVSGHTSVDYILSPDPNGIYAVI